MIWNSVRMESRAALLNAKTKSEFLTTNKFPVCRLQLLSLKIKVPLQMTSQMNTLMTVIKPQ